MDTLMDKMHAVVLRKSGLFLRFSFMQSIIFLLQKLNPSIIFLTDVLQLGNW